MLDADSQVINPAENMTWLTQLPKTLARIQTITHTHLRECLDCKMAGGQDAWPDTLCHIGQQLTRAYRALNGVSQEWARINEALREGRTK